MATAFVTGSTGLLGSNLVRALSARGWRVRALVRSRAKAATSLAGVGSLELVEGDLLEPERWAPALDGADAVFHTAAYFREYGGSPRHWHHLERVNVLGTLRVAEEADRRRVARLVDTSSAGVVGRSADGGPGDEDSPPAAVASMNLYFRSKLLARERLEAFVPRSGLVVNQVLPGFMLGPGDDGPTPAGRMVVDYFARKLPGLPPGGISTVDARDVATGMVAVAERGRPGARYILGGRFVPLEEFAAGLAALAGRRPLPRLPLPLVLAYARALELVGRLTGREPLVSAIAVRTLAARIDVTSARAERELGWTFRPFAQTLRDAVAHFVRRGLIAPDRVATGALEGAAA